MPTTAEPAGGERILLSDYVGHSFTVELVDSLRRRSIDAHYSYCPSVVSPKGSVGRRDHLAVSAGSSFERYRPWKRLVSEVRYGLNTARAARRLRPDVHVVCNMPLVSLLLVWVAGAIRGERLVIWFQDVQSGLAAGVLRSRRVAAALSGLETFVLRRADRVVAISDELADDARRRGVEPSRITVLENWAPIERLPVVARRNRWSSAHGLDDGPTLLYSGTLARKHRPELLAQLARGLAGDRATVVVVSEGYGADRLAELRDRSTDLDNLTLLPFQPFECLPDVLASADVLLVLLEADAGRFSVPSKILSYLCAARPVLGAMPSGNAATRTLTQRTAAGVVVAHDDGGALVTEARRLILDPARRAAMGAAGRAYAERHFAEGSVVERFLDAIAWQSGDFPRR